MSKTQTITTRKHSISFKGTTSKVQPQFAEESDINNIMRKYAKTGIFPDATRQAQYLDISEGVNFTEMQNKVLEMNRLFNDLPSEVRHELRTPEEFYNSFQSKTGIARLEALGILSRKENPATESVGAGSGVQPQNEPQAQKTSTTKTDKKAE